MNKLIIFNEPVQWVRKSQQTVNLRIGKIREQLFSSRQLTDSIIYLERVSSELNSQVRTGRTCERMRARNWKVSC